MSATSSGEIVGECIIGGRRVQVQKTIHYNLVDDTGDVLTTEQPFSTYPSESEMEAASVRRLHHAATVDTFTTWAERAGITPEDLDMTIHDLLSERASNVNNEGLSGQIEYMIESCGEVGARELLVDCAPEAPSPLYALSELRGHMADGYDDDAVNSILGQISEATKRRLVCVWDKFDEWGVGGNSQFYIEAEDGQLLELVGNLWPWLNGDRDDSATPHFPGTPDSWVGSPTGMTMGDLSWDDSFHNYAVRGGDEQHTEEKFTE
ncbi:hypothetical protein ACFV1N_48480 [Streptosporangium canum]|uniref:hypothetical protein n=1 Tax=Streptosporangium canum TaxID=324952 RepID=UPI0036B1647F